MIWRSSLTFSRVQLLLSVTSAKGNTVRCARHTKFSHGYCTSNSTTGNYLKLLWSMLVCLKYKQDYKSPHLNNNLVQSDIASTWDRQIKSVVFGAWKATVVFSSRNNSKTEPGVARNKTS